MKSQCLAADQYIKSAMTTINLKMYVIIYEDNFKFDIIYNIHDKYVTDLCEQFLSHRTLPPNITDIDCEGLCTVRFSTDIASSENSTINAYGKKLCHGVSGADYCSKGKEVT